MVKFMLTSGPITAPVPVFLVLLAIMLIAPLVFERLRLPGIVGLIIAGVIVGPNGLNLLQRDATIVLLGTVGLLFLMFLAGLETSLDDLKLNADKAVVFGLATFSLPMILGTGAMLLLGYSWLAAILVASCFATHTLLALPILTKLGLMRTQTVTATLGGTLITNVLGLLVLAIVVKAYKGNLTLEFWLFLIPSLAIYTFATLWGVPKIGRWFFKKFGHDENAEFIFVLATLFLVSYAAEIIEIEAIIGAFLSGIAITQLIPKMSPLMNRIEFIGNTLFVPFFLISVGMLIDPLILVKQPQSLLVAAVMILAEVVSKFLAAWLPGKLFRFEFPSIMVMFGLSVAQAASTLAAITVAFDIKLVDRVTVNGIIAMILVTCVASPWIVSRWGQEMQQPGSSLPAATSRKHLGGERVLVPVANPNTEDNLLRLALILAKTSQGTLLPLHILSDRGEAISPADKMQQTQLLTAAETVAHAAACAVEPIARIDDAIDRGILRSATEREASLIVCGWKGFSTTRDNFFGSIIDNVVRRSPVPVLIARFPNPLQNTARVIVAVTEGELTQFGFQETVDIAKSLAEELKASLQVLLVATKREQSNKSAAEVEILSEIPVNRVRGNFIKLVSQNLLEHDLLILTTISQQQNLWEKPGTLKEPEAIARTHQNISMLVVYFPVS
ncbi:transporter, CPA2 family [Oscillatoria nigro-viridis PCC 7112]|uniref:Transporter, CPA2 family n=2 Tax=Phormidium nigroviride TaxID=482564 RepID=K9VGF0_9CYAN|nr:transporter, CPA2 family [Oscillatoria nigro-viridis PCC 7112]